MSLEEVGKIANLLDQLKRQEATINSLKEELAKVQDLRDLQRQLLDTQGALNLHLRTEFTRAHPRNGFPAEVKRYLGVE